MSDLIYPVLASAGHDVSTAVTALFALLLVGLIACLALEEKLHAKKSVIAGGFAIVCLFLGAVCELLPFERIVVGSHEMVDVENVEGDYRFAVDGHTEHIELNGAAPAEEDHAVHIDGHRLSMPVYIPGIDWSVIAIIVGSSVFVDVTSRSGLFTWIALRVTKASGGDPLRLLYSYGIMTVVFSAVLNNVTAMIIVGSLTVVSLEKLERRDKLLAFLLIEGLLTNIGGLLTLISSVPNIIVGAAAGISFLTFFVKAAPFVAVATWLTIWMGARLFKIERLPTEQQQEEARQRVAGFDENDGVESWSFFWFGAAALVLFILTIATTSVLPYIRNLEMGFVALMFAGIMLMRYKSEADTFYKAIDWDLIVFFMALFVVIYVMEQALVLQTIGDLLAPMLALDERIASASLLVSSSVFSSVTDNIPLSAMLAKILQSRATPVDSLLWWAVIFGANLGGNITPIGSASTLVAVTIMHKHKLKLSFAGFVKAAAVFALAQIVLAVAYVLIVLPWLPSV